VIAKWVIIGWLAVSALIFISRTGKPRKTLTPGDVVVGVLEYVAAIVAIVLWWH
jgi:hypothetical protein